jgi:carbon storage regulator
MLVLSRRAGEEIVIAGNIRVTVVSVEGGKVRLGVSAPATVAVHRKEVHDRLAAWAATPHIVEATPAGDMI